MYPDHLITFANNILISNVQEQEILISDFPDKTELLIELTSFLSTRSKSITKRACCVVNNITSIPTCKLCDNPVKYHHVKKNFRTYCSKNCSNASYIQIQQQRILEHGEPPSCTACSNIVKFDITNNKYRPYCSSDCRAKDMSNVLQKMDATNLKKHGTKHPQRLEHIKEKTKQTNLKKYGVEYTLQNSEIRERIKQTNLEKYGFKSPIQNTSVKEKIKKTNLKKHGVENYKHTFIKHALSLLNSKEWLYNEHVIKKKSMTTIAHELLKHSDHTVIYRYLIKHNIEIQYYFTSISTGEKEVADFIKLTNILIKQNNRKIIPPYELDIYIPEYKLAIEYCGLYWHSEQQGKDNHYHKRKHDLCKEQGIQLLMIFEDEWQQRQEQVKNKILSLLNKTNQKKVFARKTNIIKVSTKQKQEFFDINHIQGSGPGSINIGLEYEGVLVACMSFIKQKEQHYLNRYATSCNIPGGFSKLLKYFRTNYEWQHLISFADLRWSDGNLYEKNGWKLDSILPPDYYYSPDGRNRYHKFGYRRQFLPKLLKDFNPELSEKENCNNNGILRIWDCGKLRYILNNA